MFTSIDVLLIGIPFLWSSATSTLQADSLTGATRLSCMIMFILAGAAFLTKAMALTGIPAALAEDAPLFVFQDQRGLPIAFTTAAACSSWLTIAL